MPPPPPKVPTKLTSVAGSQNIVSELNWNDSSVDVGKDLNDSVPLPSPNVSVRLASDATSQNAISELDYDENSVENVEFTHSKELSEPRIIEEEEKQLVREPGSSSGPESDGCESTFTDVALGNVDNVSLMSEMLARELPSLCGSDIYNLDLDKHFDTVSQLSMQDDDALINEREEAKGLAYARMNQLVRESKIPARKMERFINRMKLMNDLHGKQSLEKQYTTRHRRQRSVPSNRLEKLKQTYYSFRVSSRRFVEKATKRISKPIRHAKECVKESLNIQDNGYMQYAVALLFKTLEYGFSEGVNLVEKAKDFGSATLERVKNPAMVVNGLEAGRRGVTYMLRDSRLLGRRFGENSARKKKDETFGKFVRILNESNEQPPLMDKIRTDQPDLIGVDKTVGDKARDIWNQVLSYLPSGATVKHRAMDVAKIVDKVTNLQESKDCWDKIKENYCKPRLTQADAKHEMSHYCKELGLNFPLVNKSQIHEFDGQMIDLHANMHHRPDERTDQDLADHDFEVESTDLKGHQKLVARLAGSVNHIAQ